FSIFLLGTSVAQAVLVSNGILQLGHYSMKWDHTWDIQHRLEIMPNSNFRYWDSTSGDVYFFEGYISGVKKKSQDITQFDLIVEKDGLLIAKEIYPRSEGKNNLRIRRIRMEVLESSFTSDAILRREVSYRNQDFRIQNIRLTVFSDGNFRHTQDLGS